MKVEVEGLGKAVPKLSNRANEERDLPNGIKHVTS